MATRALMDAIRKGDVTAVKSIVATDSTAISSPEDPVSAVLTAIYQGQSEIADFLSSIADLDVFEAAASGRADRLSKLIAADPDLIRQSTDGWTPLHLAAFFGRT